MAENVVQDLIEEYLKRQAQDLSRLDDLLRQAIDNTTDPRLQRAIEETERRIRENTNLKNLTRQLQDRWTKLGKATTLVAWLEIIDNLQDWIAIRSALENSDTREGKRRDRTICLFGSLPPNLGKQGVNWKGPGFKPNTRARWCVSVLNKQIQSIGIATASQYGRANRSWVEHWVRASIDLINAIDDEIIKNTVCKAQDQPHPREYYDAIVKRCLATMPPKRF